MKDLMIVVADKNMEFALRGILGRANSLHIRPTDYEIEQYPGRDGGVRVSGPEFLAPSRDQFHHGIIMFDHDGCGAEGFLVEDLERELDVRLQPHWLDRAKSIVIQPEVDIWIWGSDNSMRQILGWDRPQSIREWLKLRDFEFEPDGKPHLPKEALAALMKEVGLPRSSDFYRKLTSRISLARCTDPAFSRLRSALQAWFPPG